jgi:CheY-like chemotaxis protein
MELKGIKLVSGGQTGADRAALDFAIERGIPHGGWCPAERKAEDGVIPLRFRLRETPSAAYSERSLWNVRDSDGTVIFTTDDQLTGGSNKTAQFARKLAKPWLHLAALRPGVDCAAVLRGFIRQHGIRVLNIAGPRKSQEPTVGRFVTRTLRAALSGRMSAQRTLRALVVDDEEVVRSLYRVLLPGFRVFEAETSEQALRLAQRHRFNVVITDYSRPGKLDGLQFIAAFNKAHPSSPVIMATGRDIRSLRSRALRLGAHAFLAKPFRAAPFRAAVDYAISHPLRKREVLHSRG